MGGRDRQGQHPQGIGWATGDRGVVFSNSSHGSSGTIDDQVMLGDDPQFGAGIVKIVRPDTDKEMVAS